MSDETPLMFEPEELAARQLTRRGLLAAAGAGGLAAVYGLTAARRHRALGRARRPTTTTIDIHAHIVIPAAAKEAGPHVDLSKVPLAHFADAATRALNAEQEKDRTRVMTDIGARLLDLDAMGIDIQVVAPAPPQCYYSVPVNIAETAHRIANEGVAEYIARRPDRFIGLGVTTMQEPELAVRELETAVTKLGLKGVQVLTSVNGEELSDKKFLPFFAKAEELGAFIMMHPNGFTHADRLTHFYFNNVLGNPLETTLALHNLIFNGTLGSNQTVKVPNLAKWWWVKNATAGAFTLKIQTPSGSASTSGLPYSCAKNSRTLDMPVAHMKVWSR